MVCGNAVASAATTSSLGPASMSMPTRPVTKASPPSPSGYRVPR